MPPLFADVSPAKLAQLSRHTNHEVRSFDFLFRVWPASAAAAAHTFQPDESLAPMLASALRSLVGDHFGFLFVKHARPADRVFWIGVVPARHSRAHWILVFCAQMLPRRASLSLTLPGASISLLDSSACRRTALKSWRLICTTVRTRLPCPPAIPVRCTAIPRFLPTIPSSASLIPQQAPRLPPRSAWACLPGALMAPRPKMAQMVLLMIIDSTRALSYGS